MWTFRSWDGPQDFRLSKTGLDEKTETLPNQTTWAFHINLYPPLIRLMQCRSVPDRVNCDTVQQPLSVNALPDLIQCCGRRRGALAFGARVDIRHYSPREGTVVFDRDVDHIGLAVSAPQPYLHQPHEPPGFAASAKPARNCRPRPRARYRYATPRCPAHRGR